MHLLWGPKADRLRFLTSTKWTRSRKRLPATLSRCHCRQHDAGTCDDLPLECVDGSAWLCTSITPIGQAGGGSSQAGAIRGQLLGCRSGPGRWISCDCRQQAGGVRSGAGHYSTTVILGWCSLKHCIHPGPEHDLARYQAQAPSRGLSQAVLAWDCSSIHAITTGDTQRWTLESAGHVVKGLRPTTDHCHGHE